MKNILTYLKRHTLAISRQTFNELDAAILSQIVYLPLAEALTTHDRASMVAAWQALQDTPANKPYEFMLRPRLKTLQLSAASPRLQKAEVALFREDISNEIEMQFCAVTFLFADFAVVSFRGTDLTLAGWKEDLNMAYQSPVPAQRAAIDYLHLVASKTNLPLYVVGHSKGGNLAVYASMFCRHDVRRRIIALYALDGPGLRSEDSNKLASLPDKPQVFNLLPRRTVVGILFQQVQPYQVVYSRAPGLLQHDPYRWHVRGTRFVPCKQLSVTSRLMDDTLNQWMQSLSQEECRLFADTVYQIAAAAQQDSLGGIVKGGRKSAQKMVATMQNLPSDVRRSLLDMIGALFHHGWRRTWHTLLLQRKEANP